MDRHSLTAGQQWRRGLQAALDRVSLVLVVLSPKAVASPYVQAQYCFGLDEGKLVIPLYYLPCKVPLELRSIQWIDFEHSYAQDLSASLAG